MIEPSRRLRCYGNSLPMLLIVGGLAGCQGARLMPTPNMYVQSPSNPFAEVTPSLRTNTVDASMPPTGSRCRQRTGHWRMGMIGRRPWRSARVWSALARTSPGTRW